MLENYNVILASKSPRRQELLRGLDVDFSVYTIPNLQETFPGNLTQGEIPLYLAEQKSSAYNDLVDSKTIVITADTIVWHGDRVIGKPKNKEDAVATLKSLAGSVHQVYSGVCISSLDRKISFVDRSNVKFAPLSSEEIEFYVDRYKPYDKAGSYGVQEWIGYVGVQRIEGSFYNIMGLPVHLLYKELKKIEIEGW